LFTVEVRDHIMIAHSFRGTVFGPAQALHGATFVVDAAFIADDGLAKPARAGELGREGRELKAIRITISESHVARAQYEAPLW